MVNVDVDIEFQHFLSIAGLFKGEKKEDDRQCQVKWEEVWKPHCTTSYEQICRNEPKQVNTGPRFL